ncbi:MAG: PAS domain-containing protein [Gemmatimonadaceae bacterium]|nr:PAS domain-containing protein [Gemmatimonadaceae bacterium]
MTALEHHMALLESVFERAPVGLAVVDRDFRYQLVNPLLAAINGVAASDHIGRTPAEIVPEVWPQIEPLYAAVLRGETVANMEMSGVIRAGASGGERRHWLTSCFAVRQGSEIIGIGIIVSDVTEQRLYRDQLRVRDDLYAMLTRTSRAAIERRTEQSLFEDTCRVATETGHFLFAWIGVPDGDRVRCVAASGVDNGYMSQLVITLDEADPRSHGPTGVALREDRSAIANDFVADRTTAPWHLLAARAGFAASAAFPLHERGKVRAVLTLYAGTAGFFTPDLIATLSEMTPIISFALDALASEEEKRRDDAELRLRDRVIRAVSSGICITDAREADNPMLFVSPGFERITGYPSHEVIGRNCRMLQGADTDPAALDTIRRAVAAGEGCTVELRNYRKDGTPFWNELSISPVTDDEGTLTHFVGVQADVTERRRLEEQMRQAQKMEAVGQLASGVAHDFNNLLTVIDVCSDLLARSLRAQPESLELAVEIQKAGERAGTLTRQLLAFSRKQVVAPRILDINEAVADSSKLLTRLLGEHVILVTEGSNALPPVLFDPGQFEQLLVNLAVNARDAMPMGGRLTLRTKKLDFDAPVGVLQAGPHVLLEVSDTGCGMSDDTRRRIFEPFFTTKSSGKGTGLGLATVRSIVDQARGDVTVETELGRGTTFRIYLPCVARDADEAPERVAHLEMPQGTETILLVEDDEFVRALGQRALRRCGYTVLCAANGQAALEFARQYAGTIHLLVSDVVMPHLGGRQLAEAIATVRPDCKVMFVSGYTDDDVLRHGVIHSEVTMLQKPYSMMTLAQTVRRVIDGGA